MKTIEVTSGNENQITTIFVEQINYFRPKDEYSTWINFGENNQILVKSNYSQIRNLIKSSKD